jgi:hypothetical protein
MIVSRIRFLSIDAGFEYLKEINFIEPEVELWRTSQVSLPNPDSRFDFGDSLHFHRLCLEHSIRDRPGGRSGRGLFGPRLPERGVRLCPPLTPSSHNGPKLTPTRAFIFCSKKAVVPPPHMYGALAKTAKGCECVPPPPPFPDSVVCHTPAVI